MRPSIDFEVGARQDARPAAARAHRRIPAHVVFYPIAAAYALAVVPVSVLSLLGIGATLPGLAWPVGHAHEMIFGFALAVISGNQLGPMNRRPLILLLVVWLAARIAFLFTPQSMVALAANVAYAVLLGWRLVPRLAGSAKKLRNMALPAVLTSICVSAIALQVALRTQSLPGIHAAVGVSVPLLALLMLFMGGRLIAAAVAGQLYRQGDRLAARVQPRLEGALIVSMGIAALAAPFADSAAASALEAVAMLAAGVLAAVRLVRWRLWAMRGRPDLVCLALGYAWLAAGIVLFGIALAAGRYQVAVLHVILVGGLGTLTLNVMAMTHLLKARERPSRERLPVWGTVLIGVATLTRVASGFGLGDYRLLLLTASLCWSSAFALLLWLLVRERVRSSPSSA
jgi:uncharacterized protein involved in response to NO